MNKQIIKDIIVKTVSTRKYIPKTENDFLLLLCSEYDKTEELDSLLKEVLKELTSDYILFLNKNGEYLNCFNANKYVGTISIKNNNYGFVTNLYEDDYYVPYEKFNSAMDKDIVLYQTVDSFYREAKVLKVIKRNYEYIVGQVSYANARCVLTVFEKNFNKKVFIQNINKAKVNDIVRCKINSYGNILKVDVCDILGNKNSLGIDITSVLAKKQVPYIFDDKVLEEANSLERVNSNDYKRFDKDLIFTIDSEDAKDLDDAVSISLSSDGFYCVGVYIASVSHYVKEDSEIDIEALNRGTSIYLVDRVIPMLPEKLSNDLCSLNPNEDKIVLALFMKVDKKGAVIDSYVEEGIIKTTKRLAYNKCNEVLNYGVETNEDYKIAYDSLKLMKELSDILRKKRVKRGAIDFDTDEVKVVIDDKGKAIDLVKRDRGVSERIIEELMILANETVTEMVSSLDLPFIYRVHEPIDIVKYHMLKQTLENCGYKIKNSHPKEIQNVLNNIESKDSFLKTTILRLMNKAIYSEVNIGHFGLASSNYTHFTSPIRRYPDLIVHRLLKKYFIENVYLDNSDIINLTNKIQKQAQLTSEKEKRAADCEFTVLDMKKAEYMSKYLGDTFKGVVSTILKFGIFITLENTCDGLVSSKKLLKAGYKFSNKYNTYIDRNNNKISLGDEFTVKLISTNKQIGEIDFELVINRKKHR